MLRLIALAVIPLIAIPAAFAQDTALIAALKNPYDLARYIDSHKRNDLKPVWKALHLGDAFTNRCGEDGVWTCSVDLLTVLKPEQVILALQTLPFETYLRFFRDGAGWRYAGSADSYLKNHVGRHEITRVGEKTFLRISGQGASGSDWDSEVESWYDLSRQDFEPVFGFTVQGSEGRMGFGVSRRIYANAQPGPGGNDTEAIELDVEIHFTIYYEGDLGYVRYKAGYQRSPKQQRFTLHDIQWLSGNALKISNKEFENLARITEGGPTNGRLLVYALPRLKAVATGSNTEHREWLVFMLSQCKDTPEKRELQKLLDRKP